MSLELINIYGPISIHWYGLMIFIAVIVTTYALYKDPIRRKLITKDQLFDLITLGILSGIIGGRFLFVIINIRQYSCWWQIGALWDAGFSIMGTIVGIWVALIIYVHHNKIAALPLMDLFATYAPLAQSISRLGCFLAGCCYGIQTTMPWGITYGPSYCGAPQGILLHPTQLYSAGILFVIFLVMCYLLRPICKKPGQLTMLYLIMTSGERFIVDFWRGDREYMNIKSSLNILSVHQYLALCLGLVALVMLIGISVRSSQRNESV